MSYGCCCAVYTYQACATVHQATQHISSHISIADRSRPCESGEYMAAVPLLMMLHYSDDEGEKRIDKAHGARTEVAEYACPWAKC